ncbi:MAG: hypothetical protein J6I40_08520 [Mailhella sp.]|nr:hypothetical protein [Mailhella sp.]
MVKYITHACLCATALLLTACFPFKSDDPAQAEPSEPAVQVQEPAKAEPAAAPATKKAAASKKSSKAKAAPAKKTAAKKVPSEAQAKAELDEFVASYVERANKSMNGSKNKPKIFTRKGMQVVQYSEIDPKTVRADMRKSVSKHFDYVASMHYMEKTYESVAKTQKAAKKGPFRMVNSRSCTELPRYFNGKWEN